MSKTAKIVIWVVVIILILITILTTKTPKNKEIVDIGILLPLSGLRADAGELSKNAIEIAKEEINNDQKRSYKLSITYEDTKYEPQTAVGAITKLININNIDYFIGPGGSSEVLAIAPILEKAKKIIIIHGAQSDEISTLGDYIFRIIHNTKQEAPIFAKFVAQKMKGDKLHFLAMNTAAIDSYVKNFTPTFEQNGKKVGLVEKFDTKTVDFKDVLTKLKSEKAIDIFVLAVPKQVGIIIKQSKELGMNVQFWGIGSEGSEIVAVAGNSADGYIYPYSYDHSITSQRVFDFYNKYIDMFKKEPDALAANAYDAVYLLSNCIEKNGNDVEKVKSCLYSVKDFEGAGGKFSIDSNGDAVKDIFIKTIKNGKFIKY